MIVGIANSIVGRDFLPRGESRAAKLTQACRAELCVTIGNGIITRRPLILQLIHTPTPKGQDGPEGCEIPCPLASSYRSTS